MFWNIKVHKSISFGVVSYLPETFVGPKTIPRPESFVTEVAGDDDSFEMVCFNVIFYVGASAFLSTDFAPMSSCKFIGSIGHFVLALLHH